MIFFIEGYTAPLKNLPSGLSTLAANFGVVYVVQYWLNITNPALRAFHKKALNAGLVT